MILAFNTSLADLHIGLFSDDGKSLAEYHHLATPTERHIHDALLAQSTEQLLKDINAKGKDINRIVFINGPGSFTGLRIGLSFAKGLAFGSGAKLIPLIAHQVLLRAYESRTTNHEPRITILYPGYEKDSVYMSYSDEPNIIKYLPISDLLKMGIAEVICTSELDAISIPHHIVNIKLQTMAEMVLTADAANTSTLEPFYGTDFKTNATAVSNFVGRGG